MSLKPDRVYLSLHYIAYLWGVCSLLHIGIAILSSVSKKLSILGSILTSWVNQLPMQCSQCKKSLLGLELAKFPANSSSSNTTKMSIRATGRSFRPCNSCLECWLRIHSLSCSGAHPSHLSVNAPRQATSNVLLLVGGATSWLFGESSGAGPIGNVTCIDSCTTKFWREYDH